MKKKSSFDYYKMGPAMQKIVLLLYGGLSLGLTRRPNGYFRVLKNISSEWKKIDRRSLRDSIRRLYRSHLIDSKDNEDGTVTMVLNNNGYQRALIYDIDYISIKPMKKWDERWRLVIFDIPEKYKSARNSLRQKFLQLGFYPLQKSAFIYPFGFHQSYTFFILLKIIICY